MARPLQLSRGLRSRTRCAPSPLRPPPSPSPRWRSPAPPRRRPASPRRQAAPRSPRPRHRPSDADPWEGFNRKSYAFSQWLDRVAIRPGAMFYKRVVPYPIRAGLHNAFQNLGEPLVVVNDVIQFRPDRLRPHAPVASSVNSTVGLAGLVDVMAHEGVPHHDNGFGLTLGRLGVKPGPYIYVPVLGPTTVRDGLGQGVDVALNPFTWINYPHRTGGGDRARGSRAGSTCGPTSTTTCSALKAMATDDYATLRSFYLQNRQSQITGGRGRRRTPCRSSTTPTPRERPPARAGARLRLAHRRRPAQPTLPNAPAGDAAPCPIRPPRAGRGASRRPAAPRPRPADMGAR